MAARREEDKIALESLHVKPYWLNLWECDYIREGPQDVVAVIAALSNKLKELKIASVVAPIGFAHSDHEVVGNACLRLIQDMPLELYFYLDMPAAQSTNDDRRSKIVPRLNDIQMSIELEELRPIPPAGQTKRQVMQLYITANPGLIEAESGYEEAMIAPERYWKALLGSK